MIDSLQNVLIERSMIGHQGMPPPPPYSAIALTGDELLYDTVPKLQQPMGITYLTLDGFNRRLARLECTNQLLITGLSRWIRIRGKALNKAQYLIENTKYNNDDSDDSIYLLDRMTKTVLRLLDEAQATLDRMVTTRRKKAPFIITTSINTLGIRSKKRSMTMSLPNSTWDQRSRYQTSQQKLNQTFELLIDQVTLKEEDRVRSLSTPLMSPKSLRRLSLTPPSPILEKHSYEDDDLHYHHYNDCSPPQSPLPRQTMDLSYWALYDNNDDDDDDEGIDYNVAHGYLDDTDTILTTATSKSVKLVHSYLSPLLRLSAPSTCTSISSEEFAALPPPLTSRSSSSLPSSSSSYSLSSLASSSLAQHQITISDLQHRRKQLCRMAFNILVISRLLLHRHHHPSSSFNSNLHLLRPQHQHLWRQYLVVVFGSSPSISPLPYMCQKMLRLFFLIRFIYRLSH